MFKFFLDFVCPELNTENKNNYSIRNSYYSYHNYDKNTINSFFFTNFFLK